MKNKKLYKITNLDGTDFYTGKTKYEVGKTVEAKDWEKTEECGNGLHILEDINNIKDITGFRLPCRIFEVKIIGKDWIKFDNKIKCKKLKVVRELSIEEINEKLKNIRMINNSSAKLYIGSFVKLYNNSSAALHYNSSAELYDNSSAALYYNSSAVLLYNSSAELYDNSVCYIYSKKATFIPHSITCAVILPSEKVFTFKKKQLGKKYRIINGKLRGLWNVLLFLLLVFAIVLIVLMGRIVIFGL